MKRFSVIFSGIILSFFALSQSIFAFYSDVPPSYVYHDEIKTLYDAKLLPEEPSNMFYPDQALKIPDLYKFILSFSKIPLSTRINLPYLDTNNEAPYAKYIQTAIDLKILRPGLNSYLGVSMSVAKRTALEIMFKTLGIGVDQLFDRDYFPFKDLSRNSELAPVAQKAYEIGIVETPENMFKMAKTITRGEAIYYLYMINEYNPESAIRITIDDSSGSTEEIAQDPEFEALAGVYSALKNRYLYKEDLAQGNLLYDAIGGLLSKVKDQYTVFQEPSSSSIIDQLSNEYDGIGMSLDLINENITVVSPFKDSPAEKAGLKTNDIIIKVDDKSVIGQSAESVSAKLRGEKGTTVKITVLRNGQELSFNVTRDTIKYKSVDYSVKTYNKKNIAYINVVNFGDNTYQEFLDAAKLIVADKSIKGIILDLRNNPGGYIDVAVDMVGLFTSEVKTAVKLKFYDGEISEYKTTGDGLLSGYKTVLLINEGSASASEIVAGAMKDYKLATLIGKKSFGKGSVQEVKTYDDGSLFKYTISYWLTPNGNSINKLGITPDKVVENLATGDKQLDTALAQF
jgi:carboxyl-terminal processing protease